MYGVSNTRIDINISESCISTLSQMKNLDHVQKAKLNYLKSKSYTQALKNKLIKTGTNSIDSSLYADSNFEKGIEYIDHGYASKGLPILYNYINKYDNTIPDSLLDYLNIKICEGLRINLEFRKAKELLKNILQKPKLTPFNRAYAYNRIAAIYDVLPELTFKQRVDSIKKYSELSLTISEKYHFYYLLGLSQNELGSLYRLTSMDLELSEYYCSMAFDNFMKAGLYRNAMNTSIILSDIHIRRNELKKATECLYEVIDLLDINENEDVFMRIYLQLAKSHNLLNDYYKAYEFLSIGRLLEKQIFESIMDEKVNEMSAKYNLALKETEINKNQHKIDLQKKDIRYLSIILIISLITLIITVLFFLMKRRNLKQSHELEVLETERLKMLFESKNKELAQSLAYNIEKNDILKILKNDISNGKNQKELVGIINSNIDTTKNRQKVLLDFQNLYPNFLPKLTIGHPDLTKNELDLCALLILKLSSHEIAGILSLSDSTINKNRQRLRKKLNLKKEADLYEYLKSFI